MAPVFGALDIPFVNVNVIYAQPYVYDPARREGNLEPRHEDRVPLCEFVRLEIELIGAGPAVEVVAHGLVFGYLEKQVPVKRNELQFIHAFRFELLI